MLLPDPLFGVFEIPRWLEPISFTPEVQRLREIRLINTTTPSLPALSDTRRFTHTLGVLNLCLRLIPKLRVACSEDELRALAAAALLHDAGTPPFGHLFEYLLKAESGWTHEAMLCDLIEGNYRPEGIHHQVYFGGGIRLKKVLREAGVSVGLVTDYVLGKGRLGPLIAGSVDVDNIDNVYRMASMLGLSPETKSALALADSLCVDSTGLSLDEEGFAELEPWRKWRRKSYEILAFDQAAVQGQAMLTELLTSAMQEGILGDEHWWMTDEQLLRFLFERGARTPALRETVKRFALGDYFATIFMGWFDTPKGDVDMRTTNVRNELRRRLEGELKIPCCPYVFYDNGTFEKQLKLRVTGPRVNDPELRTVGTTSRSTIVGVFTRRRSRAQSSQIGAIFDVLADFGLLRSALRPIPKKRQVYGLVGQEELDC